MKDPFEDLRIKREQQEERERLQQEEKNREKEKRKAAIDQYSDLVKGVLDQLRQAAYPKGFVVHSDNSWAVMVTAGGDTGDVPLVTVSLKLDSNDKPCFFLCWRQGRYKVQTWTLFGTKEGWRQYEEVQAGLSREELIRALKKLHSLR
jgi:hypothetical protein